MRGRPAIYDDKDVLTKAQKVFWTKGYTATSLEDILTAMGMGSGSFYNAFKGGKKELFRKAIQQRREAFREFETALNQSDAPMELIRDFFRSMARADRETHLQGCIIVNTVVEMASLDKDLEEEAVAILKEVEQLYTKAIRRAQKNGTMQNQTDPVILGRYLVTLWNGLNVTRRMYPDNKILLKQIEMQLEILR
ncbi:TetR/AcrR family transcriptional regulator [Chitinophaga ginsengisegetis]|uniref:TetR/AcrR family transcriptional regulator n=1 Tax=Chitinophaga ginsengisegetis TaxID=393003 RepID=UPI000DB933C4|nr:TetR/AcrR family transcriptional regulator [Chitinophaga ginsengisegetis]MDR6568116.1 TetR/AcrR family transcriptional repressor of nem operon [Chitinophaga ginsengisegetis]MDR6647329.1 TetR/AcrR family transcriptional repressor of nem operon [Chitinophaga ginsengisegetis]MDR6653678.1 TetR/AcrR family transcriptional repressor of nem operon [Chitinophaga ginsengisegetis]